MVDLNNVLIFTEIYNCGKIGRIALQSFKKYHPNIKVLVLGTPNDFKWVDKEDTFDFVDISNQNDIINGYREGHLGTATIWARLIKERKEKYLIHFDSDVIFRDECLNDLFNAIDDGYDLVGPIRNYKHNPNNRDDIRHLNDVCQTLFFAFNRELVSTHHDLNTLIHMSRGTLNPLGHSVIDFFDPVMFDIVNNGGKVKFLDQFQYGGCDYYGKRNTNGFKQNEIIDFGTKLAHFSAVGSGMNFYNNRNTLVPQSYVQYAIDKYLIFSKIFYNEQLPGYVHQPKYDCLLTTKDWL